MSVESGQSVRTKYYVGQILTPITNRYIGLTTGRVSLPFGNPFPSPADSVEGALQIMMATPIAD